MLKGQRAHEPMLARFMKFVTPDPVTTCWLFQGSIRDGYGQFRVAGRLRGAHRVAFELFRGPIPEGRELDHLCRVRRCVNPWHLECVTHQENMRRGDNVQRAKTRCPRGHAYGVANTIHRRRGWRQCRECKRAYDARRRKARKELLARAVTPA